MHTGMLWFDNSPIALEKKIHRAVEYYQKKYGRHPDLCLVHPSLVEKEQHQVEISGLTVRPATPVLPGHFWIGIEDKS